MEGLSLDKKGTNDDRISNDRNTRIAMVSKRATESLTTTVEGDMLHFGDVIAAAYQETAPNTGNAMTKMYFGKVQKMQCQTGKSSKAILHALEFKNLPKSLQVTCTWFSEKNDSPNPSNDLHYAYNEHQDKKLVEKGQILGLAYLTQDLTHDTATTTASLYTLDEGQISNFEGLIGNIAAPYDDEHRTPFNGPTYTMGQHVRARFKQSIGAYFDGWFDGKITKIHTNGTYDIDFNDGDQSKAVLSRDIQCSLRNALAEIPINNQSASFDSKRRLDLGSHGNSSNKRNRRGNVESTRSNKKKRMS